VTESHLAPRPIKESDVHPRRYFTPNEIENQPCVKCHVSMVLTRVNTTRLDFEVRTFECFNCENLDKVMTEKKRGSRIPA
jgi:hypothetical protein